MAIFFLSTRGSLTNRSAIMLLCCYRCPPNGHSFTFSSPRWFMGILAIWWQHNNNHELNDWRKCGYVQFSICQFWRFIVTMELIVWKSNVFFHFIYMSKKEKQQTNDVRAKRRENLMRKYLVKCQLNWVELMRSSQYLNAFEQIDTFIQFIPIATTRMNEKKSVKSNFLFACRYLYEIELDTW